MGYTEKRYKAPNHNEYEFYFLGEYGSKGERKKSEKVTPLKIKQYNHWQQQKRTRRLIQKNFFEDDYWVTLKYKKGTRKDIDLVKKDVRKFLRRLKTNFKKQEVDLKFIYRIEIGPQGGIHVHAIINRAKNNTDKLINDAWKRASEDTVKPNYTSITNQNGMEVLANYICKEPDEEIEGQMKFTTVDESNKRKFTVSSSRNLDRLEPEKKKYSRRTMRKLIEDGPKPTPGYFIDKDSIVMGVNPFNGYTYYSYRESRIDPISREEHENELLSKHLYSHQHKNSYKA